MSEFSDMFSYLVRKKDIQVYAMGQYCNTDRSTMYKIINGKRKPPTEEVFNKICDFMHLSPSEYEEFRITYDLTRLGRNVYYRRKNVEQFMLDCPDSTYLPSVPPLPQSTPGFLAKNWADMPPCLALTSQLEFNHVLHHILIAESNKEEGHIGLMLQPDNEFLYGLLAGLKSAGNHLNIEQIICLGKTEEQEIVNLSYLKNIVPLYICSLKYDLYYYHDDINAHYRNFNGFSCMILTSEYAITCTSDYKSGILYHDAKALAMMWELYTSYRDRCTPLFHPVYSVLEECNILGNMGWDETPSYAIQPEPCLIPYITPELLERNIYPDIPGRENMIASLTNFIIKGRKRIPNNNMHHYHTRHGIKLFAETGRLQEIPQEIYHPLSPEERIFLLDSILPYCSGGYYRLLKKPLDRMSENVHLCVNSTTGYLLFTNICNQNVYLIFKEPGLLSIFHDYAESLSDKDLYTGEETAQYIKSVIQELKTQKRQVSRLK